MSEVVIQTNNLGKQYRIGGQKNEFRTLRDSLSDAFVAPFRRASKLLRGQPSGATDMKETLWALRGVSFEIKRGEVVGIIGPNGAGKTTLLKILSRITEPTEGFAEIHGRVGSLLEVGTGFHPELTGRENIYLNGAILGMKKAEIVTKFDEIVDFAEIEKFIDTPVKYYSSGMYVRLAFAVAAHLEPEILLVDEVLAVGDASFQKKCLGKMGDIAGEGRTVLFVSHNMVAVQSLCDRAIWIREGTLAEDGQTNQVVPSYLKTSFSDMTTEQRWDDIDTAPGNNEVRIQRIIAHSASEERGTAFVIDKEIEIGVEFWSLKPDQNLAITLHVTTSEDIVAFSTSSGHNVSLKDEHLDTGLYFTNCRIPANLLNNGRYRVKLLVVKNHTEVVLVIADAVSFEVLDAVDRRGAYFGKRIGVLAPVLTWDLRKLGNGYSSKKLLAD